MKGRRRRTCADHTQSSGAPGSKGYVCSYVLFFAVFGSVCVCVCVSVCVCVCACVWFVCVCE